MIGAKGFSWVLILVQVAAFYWWQVGMLGRMAVAGILLVAMFPQVHIRLNRAVHTALLIVSAIAFATEGMSQLFTRGIYGLFALLSEYLLLIQALELIRAPRPTTANYVPGLSILTFSMLLLSIEGGIGVQTLNYMCIIFVVLLVCVLRPDLPTLFLAGDKERHKAQLLLMILCAALMSGWLFEKELNRSLPQLRQMIGALNFPGEYLALAATNQPNARLVDRAGLGSIAESQLENQNELVFTVTSSEAPGYMRTVAFSSFDGVRWQNPWAESRHGNSSNFRIIETAQQIPVINDKLEELQVGMQMFALTSSVSVDLKKYMVEIPIGRGRLIPLTLNSAYVFGVSNNRLRQIHVDPHGSIVRLGLENRIFGFLEGSSRTDSPDEDYLDSLLAVPEIDSLWLQKLANQICTGQSKTLQKITALENYFHTNFGYSLNSKPDANLGRRSPLQAFLTERRKAHCEYFATACALLLRTQGIPCRLAVGYLVYEKSEAADYFVALNRNAHAWVEAYDSASQRWIIVESTPTIPEYIESHRPELIERASSDSNTQAGGSQNQFNLLASIENSAASLYALWRSFIASRFAWILPLVLAAIFILNRYYVLDTRRAKQGIPMSRAIQQADRLARKFGCERNPSETCLQFAHRIASSQPELAPLADWYQQFSSVRYLPSSPALPRLPRIVGKACLRSDIR